MVWYTRVECVFMSNLLGSSTMLSRCPRLIVNLLLVLVISMSAQAEEACSFEDVVGSEQLENFFSLIPTVSPELMGILSDAGMTSAETLDWEGIYLVVTENAEYFGDGLPGHCTDTVGGAEVV